MVATVDNILDMRYFQDFLPALAAEQLGLQLFYEVKANLSRRASQAAGRGRASTGSSRASRA